MKRKRVLIVGGGAGGASCATCLRRLDEAAQITLFERGPHVSFANCGLPYHIGGVIEKEEKLLVSSHALNVASSLSFCSRAALSAASGYLWIAAWASALL